jgi:CHAT domain-containing protein
MEDLRELGAGTVALYTLVGEEKYRVMLITPDVQIARESPIAAAELSRKVLAFRQVLQNPRLDPVPLAQELYRILVGPVAHDLQEAKAETLMWSLDGVLRYLPVAALHDGQQYMVERYRNAIFTPASQARLKDRPSARWKGLGLGVSQAHEGFLALPAVADELSGIIREENGGSKSGVLPGTIKLDGAFTAASMLAALRQRYPVVHIASHFQFQPGNETASFLLLGDGSHLSLSQIKTLPNVFGGVDLLTLSACDTATGGAGGDGKEIEGFGVLAQRQGAKAVVATLWPVADESTKELMQTFYRLRETRPGMPKVEALRQAQLALLHGAEQEAASPETPRAAQRVGDNGGDAVRPRLGANSQAPHAHPYYWAPFILIGNWQ